MAITKIDFHLPVREEFSLENFPPMQFREDSWLNLVRRSNEFTYRDILNRRMMSNEEAVNEMYWYFKKIPGDVALKVVAKTFGLDIESKEIARELYNTIRDMRREF